MSIRRTTNAFKQLSCCLCGQQFDAVETLESHLASIHVFYMAYECDYCTDASFPSEFALREHYTKIHSQNSFVVKFRVSPELDERREMLRRLVDQSLHKSNCAISQNKTTNLDSDSYTSQLLKNCTSLLQTQLLASNRFLDSSPKKVHNEWEKDSDGANDHFGGSDGTMWDFAGTKCKASTGQKRAFSDSNSILKMEDHLFSLPMNSHDIPLNTEEMNDAKLEIKGSPIKKHAKRQRTKQQKSSSDQLQANCSHGSKEETKQQQKGPMVECSGCKRMVGQYRNSMLIHVSTHHCDLPIFECVAEGCGKKWYSISARTKEHIEAKHGGDYKFLQDNRSSLLPFLRSTAVSLFPGDY